MRIIQSTIVIASILLSGCSDNRPDEEVVEGLRGLYPGGMKFGQYKSRVISRGSEIVPELLNASHDTDPKMRESVARCLGLIGADEAVDRLIEMADDNEIEDTVWIALGYSESPKAVPKLEEEFNAHSDDRSRGRLLIALAECGDTTRLRELLEIMKTTKLEGHIYHGNQVFEKIAGRKFYKDTNKIEAWLEDNKLEPVSGGNG